MSGGYFWKHFCENVFLKTKNMTKRNAEAVFFLTQFIHHKISHSHTVTRQTQVKSFPLYSAVVPNSLFTFYIGNQFLPVRNLLLVCVSLHHLHNWVLYMQLHNKNEGKKYLDCQSQSFQIFSCRFLEIKFPRSFSFLISLIQTSGSPLSIPRLVSDSSALSPRATHLPLPPRTTQTALPLSYRAEIQEVAEFLVSSHCSHSLLLFVHTLQSLINPMREICRYRILMALASIKKGYMQLIKNREDDSNEWLKELNFCLITTLIFPCEII